MSNHRPLFYPTMHHSENTFLASLARLADALETHAPDFTNVDEIARIQKALLAATIISDTESAQQMEAVLSSSSAQRLGKRLRALNSDATDAVENAYALRVLDGALLPSFPHFSNYKHLHMHLAVAMQGRKTNHLLFVGSGPFPITAMLATQLFAQVTCVDYNASANETARRLVEKSGLASRISFITADARSLKNLEYDAILVASLVGSNEQEKKEIFQTLKSNMRPGTVLAGRDAHGLRSLVYQRIPEEVWVGMELISTQHAGQECMNSLAAAECVAKNY